MERIAQFERDYKNILAVLPNVAGREKGLMIEQVLTRNSVIADGKNNI